MKENKRIWNQIALKSVKEHNELVPEVVSMSLEEVFRNTLSKMVANRVTSCGYRQLQEPFQRPSRCGLLQLYNSMHK